MEKKGINLPSERIKRLREIAWHLARVTRKYDRLSVYKTLTESELRLLHQFEIEEDRCYVRETEKRTEEFIREHEEFIRENNEFMRKLKRTEASSTINYLFPIGEA